MNKKTKPKKPEKKKTVRFKKLFSLLTLPLDILPGRTKIVFPLFLFVGLGLYLFWGLPAPWSLASLTYPVSTKIMDRNGQLLYEIYTDQNRTPVKLSTLPDYVKWATISAEDKDFYTHHGFDIRGMVRAGFNTVFRNRLQGGSTITQQLVKNALLTQDRTVKRKIREFVLTLAVESMYSKDQILEMYLNGAPYGGTAWGIESAAQTYFNKPASDLNLSEAALLAGLPASPTRYSPFGNHPELAKQKQEIVLDRMLTDKRITEEEAQKSKDEPLNYSENANPIKAPHFVMEVKEELVEKYGEKMVEQGGLRVTTTLDLDLQNFAQGAVATEVAKLKTAHVTNGATIITRPKTGEILAMVGSKDYFAKDIPGNYNVTMALRQPGSSIKPINYALGLLTKRVTPATVFLDQPTCFLTRGQPSYCPDNYDNSFHGPVQLRFSLGNSYNIPAVKMLAINSLEEFIDFAQKMGLTTLKDPSQYGLSLTLGGGEVRMIDMATAFGVFANLGTKQPPIYILKVEDYKGKVLEENKIQEGEKVIPAEVAYLVSHILLDNNARAAAFGSSSYLVIKNHPEVSVKTGTTNDKRDNWTIGYNPDVLVAVWVGNNDNKPMSAVASGVTGASPIWNKIISFVLKDQKQNWPSKPENVVGASVCSLSGLLPGESGCSARFEYFLEGTVPFEIESLKQTILINKDTGGPVMPNEQPQPPNVEFQDHMVIKDLLGTSLCLDCAIATASSVINLGNLKPIPTAF
ncbi:MAG: PBP1A family penicillin-binding protein [bacterium]|nr:PBP1A family penicillin-binding protein [bacterium]